MLDFSQSFALTHKQQMILILKSIFWFLIYTTQCTNLLQGSEKFRILILTTCIVQKVLLISFLCLALATAQ